MVRVRLLHRIQSEGAWTHNARTDHDWTQTVPNHSCMVTGRPVEGEAGHNYTSNGTPAVFHSYHMTKGAYVASVFDVAHDHGLATACYVNKSKLVIVEQSYDEVNGAADTTGEDDGKNKIDFWASSSSGSGATITTAFIEMLQTERPGFSFLHLVDPDPRGHRSRWQTPEYYDAVSDIDSYLADILAAVEGDASLAGNTVVIVTADHGGAGSAHTDETDVENYKIPFYVWGAGVGAGVDLYAINSDTRADPASGRIPYDAAMQPIRSGDCSNLALSCLGLPPIPGSSINAAQDLRISAAVATPPPFECEISLAGGQVQLEWPSAGAGFAYTVEILDGTGWKPAPGVWPIAGTSWTDPAPTSGTRIYRVRAEN